MPVQYPPIPSFSPEHFAVARGTDPSKHKQFRRGIEQLEQEGVVQVLRSDRRGDQAPVLAAVGPMQFEVATHRMATEFSAPISLESLPYQVARIVDPADAEFMAKQVSSEVLTRTDGVMLVLFSTRWRLEGFQRDNPDVKLGRWWRRRDRRRRDAASCSYREQISLCPKLFDRTWNLVVGRWWLRLEWFSTTTSRRARRWARGRAPPRAGVGSAGAPAILRSVVGRRCR